MLFALENLSRARHFFCAVCERRASMFAKSLGGPRNLLFDLSFVQGIKCLQDFARGGIN
jgi:hypothetical protein